MVRIEQAGNRIYLWAPYAVSKAKLGIPGASFSKTNGPHWSIPLSMVNCRTLRDRFGSQLVIGPQLTAWAREEVAREKGLRALGGSSDAVLTRVPKYAPKLAAAMESRTYQRVGAKYVAATRSALIADDPGLGKTLEALGGIIESGSPGPYLVVCPKTAVESVWVPEIKRWLGHQAISVPDGRVTRDGILDAMLECYHNETLRDSWVVAHPEMVRAKSFWECKECGSRTETWAGPKQLVCDHEPKQAPRINEFAFPQLFGIQWGAVVFDESHNSLIRKTGKNTQTRNGAELLDIRPDGVRLALSGTPFRGKKHLLWGTLNWLRPKEYTGATRWTATYFELLEGYGGSVTVGDIKPSMEKELYRELDKVMLRRTKAEAAPDMPEKTYAGTPLVPGDESSPVGVWLPMSPAQKRAYGQMFTSSVAELEGGELSAIGVLAEMTRLKQFATTTGKMDRDEFLPAPPSNKLDWLIQHFEEMGIKDRTNTTRVVVVSQFTSVLNMFARQFALGGIPVAMLTGQVTGARRAKVIKDFNTPGTGPEVLLLNVKAGGVAITIDSADEMVFLDETFIDDDQTQAEDRIHRVSKPRPVTYYYLRSLGTIEESISRTNWEQKLGRHQILDGRRGIEFGRKVMGL